MGYVGQREIRTQKAVLAFLQNALGYRYLGNWKDRSGNSNIEQGILTEWLQQQGHDKKTISRTIDLLEKANTVIGERNTHYANKDVYALLRYGVKVKTDIREQFKTVWLIDWDNIENNDFAVAEEVTITAEHTKRPDIVLYVNGIAFAVLELKRSTVSVTEGIRQNLDNQKKQFIRHFFSTIQLIMAGNDTEGLRYGVIGTPEKYYMRWKEKEAHPLVDDNPLLRELGQLCRKDRLLEIVHDFMSFDAGIKKTCRHSQYFGVKAAQERIRRREGGIIWHTQGSGKSLIMVWLSRWIRENVTGSRVLIVTDRIELDEQIERVFNDVKEDILRTKSGADLIRELNKNERWLICSLVHKFGMGEGASENDVREYLDEINRNLPVDFKAKGEIFVFVDECHRTQSGILHDAMKELLPEAMFIGFTGTPLLKKDKQKSIEVFGPYIHTYKY
ncbi:HsdR family type I site-specific deoxyribonuclease, partial [Mesotoga sp.]|uniref:HsdR family type I site-specific deoxyribonuclease n=1 Tax=Mesotoga sp. TaxID=2053577 RepID=UPI00345E860C